MRIFALETDIEKIKSRFCHEGEEIVMMTYYHGLSFFFAILREIIITVTILGLAIVSMIFEWPLIWVLPILLIVWLIFVFFNVLKAYIDWTYDFLIVTTDKIILVDQTSILKQEINPLHIENIGGINTFTQFLNIFPFGGIAINLKEGQGGQDMILRYVPRHMEVAAAISDVLTCYQRRLRSQHYADDMPDQVPPEASIPHYSGNVQYPQAHEGHQHPPQQSTQPQQPPPQQMPPQAPPPPPPPQPPVQ